MKLRYFASLAIAASLSSGAFGQGWLSYGGNPQHSGLFTGTSQSASLIQWQTPLDGDRSYYGGEILAHFAAPTVTPLNTVVHGYRYTTTVSGNQDYDNWSVMGRRGSSGQLLWQLNTDFSAPILFPNGWTSVYPMTLFQLGTSTQRGVAAGAAGGTILVRKSADAATSTVARYAFYTSATDYASHAAAYAPIKICTPLTSDVAGNIYFGYAVTGSLPSNLAGLGTGGFAKVNSTTGASIYKSVQSLGIDSSLYRSAMNASPALTSDGHYIYVAITGGSPYLAKLSTSTLMPTAHVLLVDPSIAGANVGLIDESSAVPMIGTDGHVFMGVFGNQYRESHGWMLQYDANLNPDKPTGGRWPSGAFGWDDTAVVVPAKIVPQYKGTAGYLILTKYNNYDMGGDPGADGSNRIAILDPTANNLTTDRQSGIPVMNEVISVLGPTKTNDDGNHPNAVNEWCINSAAIDVNRKSAIINSEDGHMYRWSFVSNSLTEGLDLAPPTGEAYTETAIGPDGQIYVLNNSILFAIGSTKAVSVSVHQGNNPLGNVQDVWTIDGLAYSVGSVAPTTSTPQSAGIEADFTGMPLKPSRINIAVDVKAPATVNGSLLAYNNSTKKWDTVASGAFSGSFEQAQATITTNPANYVGVGGKIRLVVEGVQGTSAAKVRFILAADQITCNAQ